MRRPQNKNGKRVLLRNLVLGEKVQEVPVAGSAVPPGGNPSSCSLDGFGVEGFRGLVVRIFRLSAYGFLQGTRVLQLKS